jgi:hypothetical protein
VGPHSYMEFVAAGQLRLAQRAFRHQLLEMSEAALFTNAPAPGSLSAQLSTVHRHEQEAALAGAQPAAAQSPSHSSNPFAGAPPRALANNPKLPKYPARWAHGSPFAAPAVNKSGAGRRERGAEANASLRVSESDTRRAHFHHLASCIRPGLTALCAGRRGAVGRQGRAGAGRGNLRLTLSLPSAYALDEPY